ELEKCSTFPEGALITWGIGHLVALKMPGEYKEEWKTWKLENLPMIPEKKYEDKVKAESKAQFNHVKQLFNSSKVLVNAVDADREGSNIFYGVLNKTGVTGKEIKRLWINSLENEEVVKGFNNLQDNEKDLLMYEEARTRQIADWLVGINGSQLYTLLLQKKGIQGTYSVGRVQSVLTYLIYLRDKEIEEFKPQPFFELEADFTHSNGQYRGKAKIKENEKEAVQNILNESNVLDTQNQEGKVKQAEKKLKYRKSPLLHSLSTLQSKANKQWKIKPKKVLDILQSLYLKKLVSYPRNDYNYITEAEFEYIVNNINYYQRLLNVQFEADTTPKERYINSQKVQEHYALVPTKEIPSQNTINKLSEEEKNIYYEVLATTLAMFHKDYKYEETHIITTVQDIEFHTKGKIPLENGWYDLFSDKKENKKEEKSLPAIQKDDKVNAELEITEGVTSPPKPYTEGQLINLMKNPTANVTDESDTEMLKEVEGIGTEATRSGIIETIKQKEYIQIKKNNVHITEKGKIISEAIEGTLLSSASMTAKWETYLKKIGEGTGSQEHFLDNINKFIYAFIDQANDKVSNMDNQIQQYNEAKAIATCPSCQNKIENKGKFYGCTGYKDGCKVSFPKKWAGKTLSEKMVKDLCDKKETSKLQGFKSKNGKSFDAELILDESYQLGFQFESKK